MQAKRGPRKAKSRVSFALEHSLRDLARIRSPGKRHCGLPRDYDHRLLDTTKMEPNGATLDLAPISFT